MEIERCALCGDSVWQNPAFHEGNYSPYLHGTEEGENEDHEAIPERFANMIADSIEKGGV